MQCHVHTLYPYTAKRRDVLGKIPAEGNFKVAFDNASRLAILSSLAGKYWLVMWCLWLTDWGIVADFTDVTLVGEDTDDPDDQDDQDDSDDPEEWGPFKGNTLDIMIPV